MEERTNSHLNNKAKEKFVLFPQLVKYKFYVQHNQMIGNEFVLPESLPFCLWSMCFISYSSFFFFLFHSQFNSIHSSVFSVFQTEYALLTHSNCETLSVSTKVEHFWCVLHKLTNRVIALVGYNFMKINRIRIWLISKTSTSISTSNSMISLILLYLSIGKA